MCGSFWETMVSLWTEQFSSWFFLDWTVYWMLTTGCVFIWKEERLCRMLIVLFCRRNKKDMPKKSESNIISRSLIIADLSRLDWFLLSFSLENVEKKRFNITTHDKQQPWPSLITCKCQTWQRSLQSNKQCPIILDWNKAFLLMSLSDWTKNELTSTHWLDWVSFTHRFPKSHAQYRFCREEPEADDN